MEINYLKLPIRMLMNIDKYRIIFLDLFKTVIYDYINDECIIFKTDKKYIEIYNFLLNNDNNNIYYFHYNMNLVYAKSTFNLINITCNRFIDNYVFFSTNRKIWIYIICIISEYKL